MIGHALEQRVRADRLQLADLVALVPGLAAREVAVGALGTVYAMSAARSARALGRSSPALDLATALSLLAWYVFAPQCLSTLAVVRRETGSWKWMAVTFFYMLALAYAAALATYQIAACWEQADAQSRQQASPFESPPPPVLFPRHDMRLR